MALHTQDTPHFAVSVREHVFKIAVPQDIGLGYFGQYLPCSTSTLWC